ncbi:hypothetical protein [Hathewaya limosa]|uniref:Lipoprotein n=1 Tax=Hathewaya limosa TaxID=1536 RepID=A0ABU0JNG2_HATLI|nr:hypothetical protein [Hathewaya limosa]MDQ0478622.1 hypothetical protein [Hathewaya limosa]
MKKLFLFIIILFSFFFGGCSLFETPSNLMSKPSTYINGESINKITELLTKEDKSLTIPLGDTDKRAIRHFDLDKDGKDELILLYKKENNYFNYGVMILKQSHNKWEILNNITFSCKNIDKIMLEDLTGDGKAELAIGVKTSEKSNKTLYIYSYHRGFFESIGHLPYLNYDICDLNNNKKNELVVLKDADNSTNKNYFHSLQVFEFSQNKCKLTSSFNFNTPSADIKFSLGRASSNHNGIFVTRNIDNTFMYTDLFILSHNKLIDVLGNESIHDKSKAPEKLKPVQSSLNFCIDLIKDINNDGIYEIGSIGAFNLSRDPQYPYNFCYWYQWDGKNGLKKEYKEYYNKQFNYKIEIPLSWTEKFAVLENVKETLALNRSDFFINDYTNKENLLFSIKVYSTHDWSSLEQSLDKNSYAILEKTDNKIYICVINEELCNLSKISLSYLKSLFQSVIK